MPKSTRGGGKRKDDAGEDRPAESEARAVDVKIKAAASEDKEAALVAGNLELLKKMQEEKWAEFDWVDAEVCPFLFLLCDSIVGLTRAGARSLGCLRRVHDVSRCRRAAAAAVRA